MKKAPIGIQVDGFVPSKADVEMNPESLSKKFLDYAPHRDIVFVLGAGASHPDGVPLQQDILPMIISDTNSEISSSTIGQQIKSFIYENFHVDECLNIYPELEAVFGFLDYFIQQNESLNSTYNHATIRQLRENLIKAIHYIVNLRTDEHSQIYHHFWDSIARNNRNVSIITLNYDTLLEQAFDFMFRKYGYLDYCIHLMNYEKLAPLEAFNFWIDPRLPVTVCAGEDPMPIKVVKLHGSLNWKYCNCCNQVLLTPWDRRIDLNRGKLIGHTYPDAEEYDYHCPIDETEFQTLIMPPSYMKSLNHPVITQLFGEAATEIRASRKIVFIGYSLSDADVHIKALFMRNLRKDVQLVVINTKKAERLKQQYCALSRNVHYLRCSFEDVAQDTQLMKRLLA